MNKSIFFLFFSVLFQSNSGFGQIVYFEDFGTGCSTGTLATAFGWTNTNTGVNEATANVWYVSAAENGVGPGNCGVGCGGTNSRTLHLGAHNDAGGDLGAAYFESDPFFCGFFALCSITNKRIESPSINCTGISNINFSFDYIENGEAASDNATVWYSADNGVNWIQIDDPPKTALCGAQGLWTTRTLTLPASADNNPAIKIGFRWVNNGNGVATDPSFAVDNIQIGLPVVLAVEMLETNVFCDNFERTVFWKTQNELNADLYRIYKSTDGHDWKLLETVSANNSIMVNTYSVKDYDRSQNPIYYYIEQVDFDGAKKSYPIMSSVKCTNLSKVFIYPNPSDGNEITIESGDDAIVRIEILTSDGKVISSIQGGMDSNLIKIHPDLPAGSYFMRIFTTAAIEIFSLIITD